MSRAAAVKWVERQDKEAQKIWPKFDRVIVKLGEGKPLSKADRFWLMNVIVRWAIGKDLRAELYQQSTKPGRPPGTDRDMQIYRSYASALQNGKNHKKAVGEAGRDFGLVDASIERIIRRIRKARPYLTTLITQ